MPTGFGYGSYLGFAQESTYGTPVAPTNFLEITEEDVRMVQSSVPREQLSRPYREHYVKSKVSVEGSVKFYQVFQGTEILLKHLFGSVASAQIGATGVYKHTFTPATDLLTGLTLEFNRDAARTGNAFRYQGCQVNKWTFTQEVENFMVSTMEVMGQDETLVAGTTPTYPTFKGVDWEQPGTTGITLDGTPFPGRMTEFVYENPLADDRYKLGQRTRIGLGRSNPRIVTGKFEVEFADFVIYNKYRSLAEVEVKGVWTGPIAAGATPYEMTVTVKRAVLKGTTPTVSEQGPILATFEFDAYYKPADSKEFEVTLSNLLTAVP